VDQSAVEASILTFLSEVLRLKLTPVDPELELVSGGHIDSMDLVRLAAHLEEILDVEIPDDDIHDDNLGSVRRMLEYAERRTSA
jgi:acyl carrier protein